MTVLTLYHGTNALFDEVLLAKSRNRRDFGSGFYTTTIREQAEQWARSMYKRYQQGGQYLYVFELDMNSSLSIKEFKGLTLEWLDFIKDNRIYGGISHHFDVVRGPVANDNTMPTIALYVDGLLSVEATLTQLAYFKANDQVSLHTQLAVEQLHLLERTAL